MVDMSFITIPCHFPFIGDTLGLPEPLRVGGRPDVPVPLKIYRTYNLQNTLCHDLSAQAPFSLLPFHFSYFF